MPWCYKAHRREPLALQLVKFVMLFALSLLRGRPLLRAWLPSRGKNLCIFSAVVDQVHNYCPSAARAILLKEVNMVEERVCIIVHDLLLAIILVSLLVLMSPSSVARLDNLGVTPDGVLTQASVSYNHCLDPADYNGIGDNTFGELSYDVGGGNITFTLNAAGRAYINKIGIAKASLIDGKYDLSDIAPERPQSDNSLVLLGPQITLSASDSVPSFETTTGTLITYPTINSIGVICTYSGDSNNNCNATLHYKASSSGSWLDALPMAKVYGEEEWAGSVISLVGNMSYAIRVTFADTDGVSGTNPVMGTTTTRPDTYTLGSGSTYYVATNGNDLATGDSSHPWLTIQHAADVVAAGDTVRIRAGTYYEGVTVYRDSGTSYSNMISFIADDLSNKPVVSGANATIEANAGSNIWTADGSNGYYTSYCVGLPNYVAAGDVRLFQYANSAEWGKRGTGDYADLHGGYYWNSSNNRLYIEMPDLSNPNSSIIHVADHSNADADSGFRIFGSDYVRIREIEIKYFQYGVAINPDDYGAGTKRSSYGIVENCYINHVCTGVFMYRSGLSNPTADWLIQDNTFYDNGPSNWPWNAVKGIEYRYGEGSSVALWYNGQGTVIRRNTSSGMFDGTASGDWSEGWTQGDRNHIRDIDIYNNTYCDCGDDGIALTGTNLNTRVWGNTIHDSLTGISSAPVELGPCYIFRNVIYNLTGAQSGATSYYAFKLGHALALGKTFYFHNTVYDPAGRAVDGWVDQDSPDSPGFNITAENNICIVAGWGIYLTVVANGSSFDYNNLYTSKTSEQFGWAGTRYNTWAAFKSGAGQEAHGLNGNATVVKFSDAASGEFTFLAGSNCINAGVVIPQINDADSNWPYGGSAPDIGALEYEEPAAAPMPTPLPTLAATPTLTPAPTPTPTLTPAAGARKTGLIIGPIIVVILIYLVVYRFFWRKKPTTGPKD